MFTFNPFDSKPFFHTAIFAMRLSTVSAKTTRSSAQSISHGHPTRNSRESAYRTRRTAEDLIKIPGAPQL